MWPKESLRARGVAVALFAAFIGLAAVTQVDWLTQIKNKPGTYSKDYNFAPQSPGGSLGVGSNTITLRPCPLGVSGAHTVAANLPHLLYISGGTGTAEAAPIAGGTCTSGLTTGTVIVTAANTHSGAWTIKSNSDGLQEAIYVAGASGRVQLPSGTVNLWANTATIAAVVIPDAYSTAIHGLGGRFQTKILWNATTGDQISYEYAGLGFGGGGVDIGDFEMETTTGFPVSGASLKVRYRTYGTVSNILIGYSYDGLYLEASASNYKDLTIFHSHWGVAFTCAGVSGSNCTNAGRLVNSSTIAYAAGAVGVHIQDTTTGIVLDHSIFGAGVSGAVTSTTAVEVQGSVAGPFNEILIANNFLDSTTQCITVTGDNTAYTNNSIQILNNHIACSKTGITLTSYVQAVRIQNNVISAVGGFAASTANDRGINVLDNVKNLIIAGNAIEADGTACIVLGGTNATDYAITNNKCNGGVSGVTATLAIYQPVNVTNLTVRGNNFAVFGSAPWVPAGTGISASENLGIDNVIPAVASAGTLAFPVNPIFTLTGTTAVTAVTVPFAAGSTYRFIATNASPGAWTAGASIGNTFTPVQNVPVSCLWDGTKAYCK